MKGLYLQSKAAWVSNFIKKRPWHRFFHVNFALRRSFLQNTSGRLLLDKKNKIKDRKKTKNKYESPTLQTFKSSRRNYEKKFDFTEWISTAFFANKRNQKTKYWSYHGKTWKKIYWKLFLYIHFIDFLYKMF